MSERKRGFFRRADKDVPAGPGPDASADSEANASQGGRKVRRSTADMFNKQQPGFDDPWSSDAWAEDWNDEWNEPGRRASVRPAAAPRSADVDAWLSSDQDEFADVTADMARKWAPNADLAGQPGQYEPNQYEPNQYEPNQSESGPGATWDEPEEYDDGYSGHAEQTLTPAWQQTHEQRQNDPHYDPQYEPQYEPQPHEPAQQYDTTQHEQQQYEPAQYDAAQYDASQYDASHYEVPQSEHQHSAAQDEVQQNEQVQFEPHNPAALDEPDHVNLFDAPAADTSAVAFADAPAPHEDIAVLPTSNAEPVAASLDDDWESDWESDWDSQPTAATATTTTNADAAGDWDDDGDMDRSVESDLFEEFDDERAAAPHVATVASPTDALDRVVESRHDAAVADATPTYSVNADDDDWDDLDDTNLHAASRLDAQLDDTADLPTLVASEPLTGYANGDLADEHASITKNFADEYTDDEFSADSDFTDEFDAPARHDDNVLVGAGAAAIATAAHSPVRARSVSLDPVSANAVSLDVAQEHGGLARMMLQGGLALAAVAVIRMITSLFAELRAEGTITNKLAGASTVMGAPVALALVVAAAIALLGRYLAGSGSRVSRSLGTVCGVVSAAGLVAFVLSIVALVKSLDGANSDTVLRSIAEFAGTGLIAAVAAFLAWRASADRI